MPNIRQGMMATAGADTTTKFAVWGWGRNTKGGLGDESLTNRSSPVQIGSDTAWVQIGDSGANSKFAMRT